MRQDPRRAGIVLDFDGTLAPIVVDPAAARPLPAAVPVVGALAARYALVAVVSGRPAEFLAAWLDIPGLERWGSYGLEELRPDGSVVVVPDAARWQPAVASVIAAARAEAPAAVGIEDKVWSATLHVRFDPSLIDWVTRFADAQAAATGLVAHPARQSVELRPPIPVDKGSVVRARASAKAITGCLVAGDDLGDLSAFRAVDSLPVAVRVAVASDETPPVVLAAADIVVDGPPGLVSLLETLL